MNGVPQLRRRVLEALDLAVKQFRTREELYPLRVPREPVPLDRIIRHALGDESHRVDPVSLRSRRLLRLDWPDGSSWELWVITLPSGLKLFCDSGDEGTHVLASGGRNAGVASERLFLELLGASAGEHFGIEMSGGAPARVRSAVGNRDLLIDFFTNLFEASGLDRWSFEPGPPEASGINAWAPGTEGESWPTVEASRESAPAAADSATTACYDSDFRTTVERWLDHVNSPLKEEDGTWRSSSKTS